MDVETFVMILLTTGDTHVQQVIALMLTEYLQYNWSKFKKEISLELYQNLLNLITQDFSGEEVEGFRMTLMRLACKIARLSWLHNSIYSVGFCLV